MLVMFRAYFNVDLWKIFAELSYFYRLICAKKVPKEMMQKLEKEIAVLVCKMEKIFLLVWFNAMQHLLVHLPWEARVGGPTQFRWMYSQERELKKLRVIVHNKLRVEGSIAEAFACKEITNFSSKYFSGANNVNAHTMWYHIVEEVSLSELSIFQWKGKGLRLLVHIMSQTTSGTIPCVTYKRSWRKSNHILTYLKRHIENKVNNLH
jgi:hypothetical protein